MCLEGQVGCDPGLVVTSFCWHTDRHFCPLSPKKPKKRVLRDLDMALPKWDGRRLEVGC